MIDGAEVHAKPHFVFFEEERDHPSRSEEGVAFADEKRSRFGQFGDHYFSFFWRNGRADIEYLTRAIIAYILKVTDKDLTSLEFFFGGNLIQRGLEGIWSQDADDEGGLFVGPAISWPLGISSKVEKIGGLDPILAVDRHLLSMTDVLAEEENHSEEGDRQERPSHRASRHPSPVRTGPSSEGLHYFPEPQRYLS